MGAGQAAFRKAIKIAWLIESLPPTEGKSYLECDRLQRTRMFLENAWEIFTGDTYTHQWYEENKKYL